METLLQKNEFHGRRDLKRTLTCRNTNHHMFGILVGFGVFFLIAPIVNFAMFEFQFSWLFTLFSIAGFALCAYFAWSMERKSHIKITLHEEGFTYSFQGKEDIEVSFSEVKSIRFKRYFFVRGFYIDMNSGVSVHVPASLERVDYILDALCFHHTELCDTDEFMLFRENALITDHIFAHNKDYFKRFELKAIWFYFAYPFLFQYEKARLRRDPSQVRRDINYEHALEHKFHIYYRTVSIVFISGFLAWMYYF